MFESWFRKVQSPNFYGHALGRPITNGGMEYGFLRRFADPLRYDTGTGYRYGLMRVYQYPQVYAPLLAPLSGLGGVQAGQVILQPLVNPDYSPLE